MSPASRASNRDLPRLRLRLRRSHRPGGRRPHRGYQPALPGGTGLVRGRACARRAFFAPVPRPPSRPRSPMPPRRWPAPGRCARAPGTGPEHAGAARGAGRCRPAPRGRRYGHLRARGGRPPRGAAARPGRGHPGRGAEPCGRAALLGRRSGAAISPLSVALRARPDRHARAGRPGRTDRDLGERRGGSRTGRGGRRARARAGSGDRRALGHAGGRARQCARGAPASAPGRRGRGHPAHDSGATRCSCTTPSQARSPGATRTARKGSSR